MEAAATRCGSIAIVGRPNVGKSTLLNALVGQKISITSRKAQTTRHRITGIRTIGATQFVFVDTPGFQTQHATALNRSLNKTVLGAVSDVDLVLFVVEAGKFTLADAKVLSLLKPGVPALLIEKLRKDFDQLRRCRLSRKAGPGGYQQRNQGFHRTHVRDFRRKHSERKARKLR